MHGLATSDGAGQHRSAVGLVLAPSADHPPMGTAAGPDVAMPAHDPARTTVDDTQRHDGHGAMAACVAVLLGLLGVIALRLLRAGAGIGGVRTPFPRRSTAAAARAPPRPRFLSLCVFRI